MTIMTIMLATRWTVMIHRNTKLTSTLLCLKWITNKDLLWSTGNSAQCYITTDVGKEFEKIKQHNRCESMYNWITLLYIRKYHIVNQLYFKIKSLKKLTHTYRKEMEGKVKALGLLFIVVMMFYKRTTQIQFTRVQLWSISTG